MQDVDGATWLLEINVPPSLAQCGLHPAASAAGAADPGATCRPDWGAELVLRMMRDLIAQFVLPHLRCAENLPTIEGSWAQVEVTTPPESNSGANTGALSTTRQPHSSGAKRYCDPAANCEVDSNLRAWATYKRALVQKVCEAQAEDDLRSHKRQHTGGAAGSGGLAGAALKDALLAQHRGRFVPASRFN